MSKIIKQKDLSLIRPIVYFPLFLLLEEIQASLEKQLFKNKTFMKSKTSKKIRELHIVHDNQYSHYGQSV